MYKQNPFDNNGPIANPRLFFNRKALTELILNNLLSGKPSCISIIGQRKIGKTSLAVHLARNSTIKEFGFEGHKYIFLPFNCQKLPHVLTDYDSFNTTLLRSIIAVLPTTSSHLIEKFLQSLPDWATRQLWDQILETLWEDGYYLIVIFDEFDKAIMRESLIKGGLFGSLRGYANDSPNFSWITITSRPLNVIFDEAFEEFQIPNSIKIAESDFFNIARPQVVTLFKEEEIWEMVSSLSNIGGNILPERALNAIVRCGGTFPYFVQKAGYYFYNVYCTDSIDQNLATQQFIDDSIPFWDNFWNKLDNRQQFILSTICGERSIDVKDYELNSLINGALIYKDKSDLLKPFSYEFGKYILSKSVSTKRIFQIGDNLHNRYRVTQVITTNHSQITKARDNTLNRFVAIKSPRIDYLRLDEKLMDRLQKNLRREAEVLAKLHHRNIGQVFDIIEEPLGIIMEWVEGQPLQDFLDDREHLSVNEILTLGIGVADALAHAHGEGVTHRDIKPNNIIVMIDKTAKLIDFDIARDSVLETITMREDGTRFQVGTPAYSSPEQLAQPELALVNKVGPASDIFSLGVVLYELLTMHLPYDSGNDPSSYEGKHFPPIDGTDIPDSCLFEILSRMLSAEPATRPDASTARDDLRKAKNLLGEINHNQIEQN